MNRRFLSASLAVATLSILSGIISPVPSRANEEASESIRLWNETLKTGQWRAFGLGTLDSQPLGDRGLKIEVDWGTATFGVGAAFEKGESDGTSIPYLGDYRKLQLEARATGEDARTITAEFVIRSASQNREKAFRAIASRTQPVTAEWTRVEFKIPADFPKLQSALDEINALRILFPKNGSIHRGQVEFRNVELSK
jgi:hypothetical protein